MSAARWAAIAAAAAALSTSARAAAEAAPPAPEEAPAPSVDKGSLATAAPLGARRVGMSLGGGVAVLLPFYAIEVGVGLGRVDLVGRFESVLGLFHYPRLGVRWSPFDLGAWKVGVGLGANYSFFGIQTDHLNLTSTFYLDGALAASGPITKQTDLVFMADIEVDMFEHDVVDDEGRTKGTFRYDAAIFFLGIKTVLTHDLDGYLRARVRVPAETFTYEATNLYVIPSLEIGGAWSF